ncbi:MAG TPA: hypothetical protein VLI04_06655 [Nocardioidaceae bacterium]|nr:hypothetical protein [Nocardioidaceae bacterium]
MTGQENEHDDGTPLDVDAEFAKIVGAYGGEPAEVTPPPTPETLADRFQRLGWTEAPPSSSDPLNTEATYFEEGHFIPPEPPPLELPRGPRLAAWSGIFGAPVISLILVLFQVSPPEWMSFLLVVAFVGGFVYLIATMSRDNDRWSGDDGAVL